MITPPWIKCCMCGFEANAMDVDYDDYNDVFICPQCGGAME